MQFSIVLTENPGESSEKKTILWTDGESNNSNKVVNRLLEELAIRSREGWNIFSVKGAINGYNIWRLTKGGQTNFLEMKTVSSGEGK